MEKGKNCGCGCHHLKSILVIAFGLTFLLGHLDVLSQHTVGIVWPSIIIVAGVALMGKGFCKCCKHD